MAPKNPAGPVASGTLGDDGSAPLSPIIHGRARLLILSFLVRLPRLHTFTDLRDGLAFTDGSLSANLAKLESAGLVEIQRSFVGRKPRTAVRISANGRREFKRYIAQLKKIVPGLN